MYGKNRKHVKKIFTGTLALAMAAMLPACGQNAQPASNGRILVLCKAEGVQFWDYVRVGAEDAGEELGYIIDYQTAKTDSDVAGQMEKLRNALDMPDLKAIVIAPNNAQTLNATLNNAFKEKDIKIITINSDVDQGNFNFRASYIGSSNESAGAVAGRQAKAAVPSGKVGIVGNTSGQQTTIERIKGFKDQIGGDEASDENTAPAAGEGDTTIAEATAQAAVSASTSPYTFLPEEYCDNNRANAKQKAAAMISANPDLVLLYGVNENSTLGICDAVAEAGKKDQITVIGFNSNDAEIQYLREGVLDGTVVQSPYNMGYLGVRYATKLIDGDKIPENIDTGITYVNRDNLNTDIVSLLLKPDQDTLE